MKKGERFLTKERNNLKATSWETTHLVKSGPRNLPLYITYFIYNEVCIQAPYLESFGSSLRIMTHLSELDNTLLLQIAAYFKRKRRFTQ